MCIDNLYGLRAAFAHAVNFSWSSELIAPLARQLVRADMGHPSVSHSMPEHYHCTVSRARQWLRDAAFIERALVDYKEALDYLAEH